LKGPLKYPIDVVFSLRSSETDLKLLYVTPEALQKSVLLGQALQATIQEKLHVTL